MSRSKYENDKLFDAVLEGKPERLRKLLSSSNDWLEGYDLLCCAVEHERIESTNLLLRYNAKVNSKTSRRSDCNTPLHLAVRNENLDIVNILLKEGANVSARNKLGETSLHLAAVNGNKDCTKLLLDNGSQVSSKNVDGARNEIVNPHLSENADINSRNLLDETPFNVSTHTGNSAFIVKTLLQHGADINAKNKLGETSLHLAAANGNFEITKLLLDEGAQVNSITADGMTPLHYARNELEIVRLLLSRNADVNARNIFHKTPLNAAVHSRSPECIVRTLLEQNADVDAKDRKNRTPLYLAATSGQSAVVEALLRHQPDSTNYSNRSALRSVVILGKSGEQYKKIVEDLSRYGFTVNYTNSYDLERIGFLSVRNGYIPVVQELLKRGLRSNSSMEDGYTLLHCAAENDEETIAKLIISHGGNVNTVGKHGKTPLYYAVENTNLEITRVLLMSKANTNDVSEPIFRVVRSGFRKFLEVLLNCIAGDGNNKNSEGIITDGTATITKLMTILNRYGANVNAKNISGKTVLSFAANMEFEVLVRLFRKYGIVINARNWVEKETLLKPPHSATREVFLKNDYKLYYTRGLFKTPPLDWAAYLDFMEKTKVDGNYSLQSAVQRYNLEIIQVLLECGAEVNAMDKNKMTPIHYSSLRGSAVITKLLLGRGADVNAKDIAGRTALHHAARGGFLNDIKISPLRGENVPYYTSEYEELVRILLQNGADVNSKDQNDELPIHFSVRNGSRAITKLLLDNRTDIDAERVDGKTALHIAVTNGYEDIVNILLKYWANINCKDKFGFTPLDIAVKIDNEEIISSLIDSEVYINCSFINYMTVKYYLGIPSQNVIDRHVKLTVADLYEHFTEEAYYLASSDFQKKCKQEIADMKRIMITSRISLYDIVRTPRNKLAQRLRYDTQQLLSGDYKATFPVYAGIIERKVKKVKLLQVCWHVLNDLTSLPLCCTEEISSYLSDYDLRNVIIACNYTEIAFG